MNWHPIQGGGGVHHSIQGWGERVAILLAASWYRNMSYALAVK